MGSGWNITYKASRWDPEACVSPCTPRQPRRHRSRCSVSTGSRVHSQAHSRPLGRTGLVLGAQVSASGDPRASTARSCPAARRCPSARHRRRTSSSWVRTPHPTPWCPASTSYACSGTSPTPRSRPGRHGAALSLSAHGLIGNRRPSSASCRCCMASAHCTF